MVLIYESTKSSGGVLHTGCFGCSRASSGSSSDELCGGTNFWDGAFCNVSCCGCGCDSVSGSGSVTSSFGVCCGSSAGFFCKYSKVYAWSLLSSFSFSSASCSLSFPLLSILSIATWSITAALIFDCAGCGCGFGGGEGSGVATRRCGGKLREFGGIEGCNGKFDVMPGKSGVVSELFGECFTTMGGGWCVCCCCFICCC